MNASTSRVPDFLASSVKPSDCEVRAVIKFLNAEKIAASEIHRRMSSVYGSENIMSLRHVYKWVQRFKDGRTDTHDDVRSGRPSDSLTDDAIAAVRALLEENRRFTITDLHREMAERYLVDCSRTTIHRILTEVKRPWL